MFLLLRVWNFVLDVAIFYTSESTAEHFKQSHAAAALIMMSVSQHACTVVFRDLQHYS